jgi:uncharacterized protein
LNDSGIHPQKSELFSEMNVITPIKPSKEIMKIMMESEMRFRDIIFFLNYFSGFHFKNYNDLLLKSEKNDAKKLPTGICIPFSIKIYMTINGNLYPCERIGCGFSMGNIHNPESLNVEQIVLQFNQYLENISPVCAVCERKFACKKCLFHIENIQGNKPQCNEITDDVKFKNTVISTISTLKKHPELYRKITKRKFSVE